ncbi:hypothetical protein SAMN05443245_5275 [Paraburkholderia fungorum]|uniref:Uncharacterized protein n=1 Tax=Paraburkholderia fungorum TaxID=134537 RepID=A0A1H1IJP6_9BURK|nr:hypothetical protein [Paraburkholderia fungorum]SDR37860.1 hypothetical protein SAMN05443245_5275 [Paraburkholderia fungorum]
MTPDQLHKQLAEQLRDKPLGTVANLTDFAVAYWDGQRVRYAFLRDEGCGRIEGEFDFTEHEFEQWADALETWATEPVFSVNPEVLEWLKDAPPHEAG